MNTNFIKTSTQVCFILLFVSMLTKAHPGIGIVKDSRGYIYYTDLSRIWQLSPDGKTKKIVVSNVHSHELYMDKDDNLFGEHLWYNGEKLDTWGTYVWKYSVRENKVYNITGKVAGFNHGHSFCRDALGNMYWIEKDKNGVHHVYKKASNGKIESLYNKKFTDVRWKYCQKDGTLLFIDDNDLYKLTPDRKLILVAQNLDDEKTRDSHLMSGGNNHNIQGIWDDEQGNYYVAVLSKSQIRKITLKGQVSIFYKSPLTWSPTGGVFDSKGTLWVLEEGLANRVRAVRVK